MWLIIIMNRWYITIINHIVRIIINQLSILYYINNGQYNHIINIKTMSIINQR